MKIIKQISDKVFEVELDESDNKSEYSFTIQHDFVGFKGYQSLCTKDRSVLSNNCNCISVSSYVQVPIRMFSQAIMNMLSENDYLKPDHLVTKEGGSKYNYYNQSLRYYDTDKKCYMIAICLQGETEFNHVTLEFYNKFVRPNL